MNYDFTAIEKKWQEYWSENKTFRADNNSEKPKFYVLDMFPYPSGEGLHVGHPLGYIASDIYSRYKRLKGYNVLHPMGYDAFGLPAEQYAIETGQHPAITTKKNIKRYREQLDNLGFSYDWDREVKTCDPKYYKWTQWIFIQLFNSWYNNKTGKAEPIENLVAGFEKNGNQNIDAFCDKVDVFTSDQWNSMDEKDRQTTLLNYRLAYLSETMVNWCPKLGTVLSNEEVQDGFSERGGYPVERKLMKQWTLRITAYAERLLKGLEEIDWTDALKDMQRNWIGRSEGAMIKFKVQSSKSKIQIFTTRPDTIFGATFMVLAPEHELVKEITTEKCKPGVEKYVKATINRSERERMADVKRVTGEFTGAYAIHPFTGNEIPIWVADYVLAGYGTGAIMAVPSGDQRDWDFAKHFDLPIIPVTSDSDITQGANENEDGVMINSDFINGMKIPDAIKATIERIEEEGIGEGKINYRIRDAVFSRQRYWGEPFPVYYKDGMPYVLDESELPLELPVVDAYLPTESGEPPLARAKDWKTADGYPLECNTMPGWAGSSWYYLRYMDPGNNDEFVSKEAVNYWKNVDLYIGGAEHATGHLLYVRFWTKFLFDLGYLPFDEPVKKLINQGMILGMSEKIASTLGKPEKIYRRSGFSTDIHGGPLFSPKHNLRPISIPHSTNISVFYSAENVENAKEYLLKIKKTLEDVLEMEIQFKDNIPIVYVDNNKLDIEAFRRWRPKKYKNAVFVCSGGYWMDGKFNKFKSLESGAEITIEGGTDIFYTFSEVEKMSKSKGNVINPDELIEQYGADTLRMYEMFLGPLEQKKPWDTKGIEGVYRFLKKLWRLYYDDNTFIATGEEPAKAELKVLHRAMKKTKEDIERYSFNTGVSALMICVNELTELKCNKKAILQDLLVIVSPYAPHIAEELWSSFIRVSDDKQFKESISKARFPEYNEEFLVEEAYNYPVSFNGKMRFKIDLSLSLSEEEIEKEVLACEKSKKWLDGKTPKKVIVVRQRIVNIVV